MNKKQLKIIHFLGSNVSTLVISYNISNLTILRLPTIQWDVDNIYKMFSLNEYSTHKYLA